MASADRDDLAAGVEHVQAAAKEMIRATRSFLDVAEHLVDDPAALQSLVATLGGLLQAVSGRLRPQAAQDPGDEDDGRVQRISLS
ncbi:MAG: hypothetical protein Q8K58_05455 [Acidimicrobiales bacterium]|nr:hypothetical protein [Acidimicrobiales bacterium]